LHIITVIIIIIIIIITVACSKLVTDYFEIRFDSFTSNRVSALRFLSLLFSLYLYSVFFLVMNSLDRKRSTDFKDFACRHQQCACTARC